MDQSVSDNFFEALAECSGKVEKYILQDRFVNAFNPEDLRDAILAYPKRSGKRLRPAVMMWCCGAAGGDPDIAIPAAAAVELFHTWTLAHDDLIDNDSTRRGGPTVHKLGEAYSRKHLGYSDEESVEYGRDIAVLAGDLQHSWSMVCLADLATSGKVSAEVALALIGNLESKVVNTLIEGETLDIQFAKRTIESLKPEDILGMLWAKTGALYEFAARAGGMIGVNSPDCKHPIALALAGFAGECGTAFQLQDDILGITGDEKKLGKPIGSDLREGKKTLVVYYALQSLEGEDRKCLLNILGNRDAVETEVDKAIKLIIQSGALKTTTKKAEYRINAALEHLQNVPDSMYKTLLKSWAGFMINRAL